MHRIATGLGGKPEHPEWSAEQTITSHVEYMTTYIDELIEDRNELRRALSLASLGDSPPPERITQWLETVLTLPSHAAHRTQFPQTPDRRPGFLHLSGMGQRTA